MSDFNQGFARPAPARADMAVDAGLRSFMLGVYNKLGIGLAVAGALAWVTGNVPAVQELLFGSMFFMKNPTARGVNMLYWAVVASIGAGMGLLFLRYTGASIASTFFITAAAFGALSLFGYTTKKDMTGWGSFLIMAVIGLVIAMVVNMFLQNPMMMLVINALGVLIFSALIAYDTQRLKLTYYAIGGNQAGASVATSYGALSLFINFINLFQFLLFFLGGRE